MERTVLSISHWTVAKAALGAHALGHGDGWVPCGPDRASLSWGVGLACRKMLVPMESFLDRVALARDLHHFVVAKRVVVVEVFVSQRQRVHPLANYRENLMADLSALAPVTYRSGHTLGQPQPAIHIPQ